MCCTKVHTPEEVAGGRACHITYHTIAKCTRAIILRTSATYFVYQTSAITPISMRNSLRTIQICMWWKKRKYSNAYQICLYSKQKFILQSGNQIKSICAFITINQRSKNSNSKYFNICVFGSRIFKFSTQSPRDVWFFFSPYSSSIPWYFQFYHNWFQNHLDRIILFSYAINL